jgi:hypothetical protein
MCLSEKQNIGETMKTLNSQSVNDGLISDVCLSFSWV